MKKPVMVLKSPYILLSILFASIIYGWLVWTASASSYEIPKHSLMPNGSMDEGAENVATGWEIRQNVAGDYISYLTQGLIDGRGQRIEISNYRSGTVSVITPSIPVEPSSEYYFKVFYLTNTTLDLYAEYTLTDGSVDTAILRNYPDYDYPLSAMSSNVVTPNNVKSIRLVISISGAGFVELDNAYVIKNDYTPQPVLTYENLLNGASWKPYGFGVGAYSATLEEGVKGIVVYPNSGIGHVAWSIDNEVTVKPHELYEFAFSYESDVPVEVGVDYTLSDGSMRYHSERVLQPTPGMVHYAVEIEIPSDATGMRPSVQLYSAGKLNTTDDRLYFKSPAMKFDKPRVSVTFDDGWYSSFKNGAQLVEGIGGRATFYINPSAIGTPGFMTKSDVVRLIENGHEIGSHGNQHLDMTTYNQNIIVDDLKRSMIYIKDLGVENINFASPYGKNDSLSRQQFMKYFTTHRGTESGMNTGQNLNPSNLKGLFIRKETTDEELLNSLEDARKSNGWLILIYHQIEPSDSPFALDSQAFTHHMELVRASNIEVMTVAQALEQLSPQISM